MDFLAELESMAEVAAQQLLQDEPDDASVNRWQHLFGYSYPEAEQKIHEHRTDLSRITITESHWEMVRLEKESQGYDKEAYEHSCSLAVHTNSVPQNAPRKTGSSIYLIKLEGPLSSADLVKSAACLDETPLEHCATDDMGETAAFCKVDTTAKEKLMGYLASQGSLFQPTFIRYSKAEKNLSVTSAYPTLGIDSTMPQHRLNSTTDSRLLPAQNQYPVWYFFYGTLGDSVVLKNLLGVDPVYSPASITGGAMRTWGGKYKALVDAPDRRQEVRGQAFLVQDKEQEEALQLYETYKYEVVRCEIHLESEDRVKGLTFRFIGDVDE
ncbi:hypothetical protein F5B19DRAFT_158197 [Rostrohypoxylon terebratum]|nr:hypothetical protein F5B19DRAFT_158197 [Rostrohypoxylon terebratum]